MSTIANTATIAVATVAGAVERWPEFYECHGYQPEIAAHFDSIFEAEVRAAATAFGPLAAMGARVAIAHGHGYASATPGAWAVVWSILNGWPTGWDRLLSEGWPGIGCDSAISHTTGSGQLRWEIRGGALMIIVSRPDGEVLRAWIRPDGEVTAVADGRVPYCPRHVDVLEFAVSTALGRAWSADAEIRFGATAEPAEVAEVLAAWEGAGGAFFEADSAPGGGSFADYAREVFGGVGRYGTSWIHIGDLRIEVSATALGLAGRTLSQGTDPVAVLEAMRRWDANP